MLRFLSNDKIIFIQKVVGKVELFALIWSWKENGWFLEFDQIHNCRIACSGDNSFCSKEFFEFFSACKIAKNFDIMLIIKVIIIFLFGVPKNKDFFPFEEFGFGNEFLYESSFVFEEKTTNSKKIINRFCIRFFSYFFCF